MNDDRYQEIQALALSALGTFKRFGSVRLNQLPKVTLFEQQHIATVEPKMLPFVRIFDHEENEYKVSFDSPTPARNPIIREIWVGARTLAAIGENDLSDPMNKRTPKDEDTAELTELATMTYDDKPAYEKWLARQLKKLKGKPKERKALRARLPQGKYGTPCYAMFHDPETGEYRPVMFGDVIQSAWGSNENLDALFMEEASDPRSESDSLWRELTRDQIRANTPLEDKMMPSTKLDKKMQGLLPRQVLSLPELELDTPRPDEQGMWREAHRMVEDLWRRHTRAKALIHPNHEDSELEEMYPLEDFVFQEHNYRELCDAAYDKVRRNWRKLAFDETAKLISGQFLDRMDFWDIVEENLRTLLRFKRATKARPKPMDWRVVRG